MSETVFGKADIVSAIAGSTGKTKVETEEFLRAFEETVVEQVCAGKVVRIPGFIAFKPRVRPSRVAHNPSTGEKVEVPEKNVVKIQPLSKFADTVAG